MLKLMTKTLITGVFLIGVTAAQAHYTVSIGSGSAIKFVWVGHLQGGSNPCYVVDRSTDNPQKIEAYSNTGAKMWTVNFGPNSANQDNISPGSGAICCGQWDGVTVYDVNGDGKDEVIIKFASGVTFGDGTVWSNSDNNKQWIGVLEGATGKLLKYCSIPQDYESIGPMAVQLGACPSGIYAVMKNRNADKSFNMMVCRYQMGSSLTMTWKWLRGSQDCPDGHTMRICDVNGDGTDDVGDIGFMLNGANGSLLYSLAGQGVIHGDRWAIAKMDKNNTSHYQGYGIQQDNPNGLYDYYYDATTGTMIWKHGGGGSDVDVGRGDVGDIDGSKAGYESWAFNGVWNAPSNKQLSPAGTEPWPEIGLWWDTDDLRESYNNGKIEKYDPSSTSTGRRVTRLYTITDYASDATGNGTYPMFWGDFTGDWREEVIVCNSSYNKLYVLQPSGTPKTSRSNLYNDRYYKNGLTIKGYPQTVHTSFYLGE